MLRLLVQVILLLSWLDTTLAAGECWRSLPCTGPKEASFKGPWEANSLAPFSRTVQPKRILSKLGQVKQTGFGSMDLTNATNTVVYDFGLEVGGIATVDYSSTGRANLGIAFSEAKNWIGEASDSSNGKFNGPDGALFVSINKTTRSGRYVVPDQQLRGGFRYMTVFLKDSPRSGSVRISDVKVEISFQPTWSGLRAYQGYFHSSDALLNRIWYSGAYTLQTNSVPITSGRQVPMLSRGWANNATLGPGDTILVDGAKRDRAVWPGDMSVAVPSVFVSTGDLESVKNALQVMYNYQNADGSFPEAGPPLLQQKSDTYHMWTLIGTYNYMLYANDLEWMQRNWKKYQKAMVLITKKVGANGLLHVTGTRDWARWQQGNDNSEANMILYRTFVTASEVCNWMYDEDLAKEYQSRASALRVSINKWLYDPVARAFKDNSTSTTLIPQDANALSLWFHAADDPRIHDISRSLTKNWTPIGPAAPELPGNISPFITSMELAGHFEVMETQRALDLLRRTWGWYLMHENGTQSTIIEGYRTDGSFGYRSERGYGNDPSYVSHSHGWSAGPTSSLTTYVAGLSVTERGGSKWAVRPQFGNLDFAEAGFTTYLGKFRAGWKKSSVKLAEDSLVGYDIFVDTPVKSNGEVRLPSVKGDSMVVWLDGKRVEGKEDYYGIDIQVSGGKHSIAVRRSSDPNPVAPSRCDYTCYAALLGAAALGGAALGIWGPAAAAV